VNRVFCVAGFRPGSRCPFLSGKCPKTIDAQSASFNGTDGNLRRAGQLTESILSHIEGLKQGPPVDESVLPLGQTAGVGTWETNISAAQMKENGIIYSV